MLPKHDIGSFNARMTKPVLQGLAHWGALREAVDDPAVAARGHNERAADLLELACLHYGVAPGSNARADYPDGPHRSKQAARFLKRHPDVARATLHTAVVCLPGINHTASDPNGAGQMISKLV